VDEVNRGKLIDMATALVAKIPSPPKNDEGRNSHPPIDTGAIHRRSQTAHIRAEVEAMLKEAEREMSAEALGGNIVKEALWNGEVTAFKKVLYLLDQSS
jgi:hypothetical protein